MKVLIVYYSMYGHIYKMAEAAADGVTQVQGCRSENVSCAGNFAHDALKETGASTFFKRKLLMSMFALRMILFLLMQLYLARERVSVMCGQMRQFLDFTGGVWSKGLLVGKVVSVFTSLVSIWWSGINNP